jgi:hypothetical protein
MKLGIYKSEGYGRDKQYMYVLSIVDEGAPSESNPIGTIISRTDYENDHNLQTLMTVISLLSDQPPLVRMGDFGLAN